MSQSNPASNPFGTGPGRGTPEAQNPFQIVGGGQPSQPLPQAGGPSPFEAVGNQSAGGQARPSEQGQPAASRPNPFQIAGAGDAVPAVRPPQPQPQAAGFDMKGFPPGPSAPLDQLDAAPVDEQTAAPAPSADPFAGMDLPQISDEVEEGRSTEVAEVEREEVADFSAPKAPVQAPVQAEPELKGKRRTEPEAKPAPPAQSAPAPAAKKQSFVPVKPNSTQSVNSQTKQLELRAIFGVDQELTSQEILQKARGLPGILQVAKANAKETAALEALQGCAARLGLEEDEPIVMSCPDGFIDFLTYEDTSLAVLRNQDYAPGVRATLLIVARELGRL